MGLHFNSVKYRWDINGLIQIAFYLFQANKILYFDGGDFVYRDASFVAEYKDWESFDLEATICSIRQTDDFDIIIKLENASFIKVYFLPDDNYPNNVVQTFTIIQETVRGYHSVKEDFNLSSYEVMLL